MDRIATGKTKTKQKQNKTKGSMHGNKQRRRQKIEKLQPILRKPPDHETLPPMITLHPPV